MVPSNTPIRVKVFSPDIIHHVICTKAKRAAEAITVIVGLTFVNPYSIEPRRKSSTSAIGDKRITFSQAWVVQGTSNFRREGIVAQANDTAKPSASPLSTFVETPHRSTPLGSSFIMMV